MQIYVASSWRNEEQPAIVDMLRSFGHLVYDFRNPGRRTGFSWTQLHHGRPTTPRELLESYRDPIAQAGFESDIEALRAADACVLVMPCGRSAHLEFGFAIGAGKLSVAYLPEAMDPFEPELLWMAADAIATQKIQIPGMLAGVYRNRRQPAAT